MSRLQAQRYRRHFFAADRRVGLLVAVAVTLGSSIYARNDFVLFRGTPWLFPLWATRGLVVLLSAVAIYFIARTRRVRTLDRALGTVVAAFSTHSLFVSYTRSLAGEYMGPFISYSLFMSALYFVLRGALCVRISSAFILSAASIVVVWSPAAQTTAPTRTSLLIGLVFFNFVGVLFSRAFDKERQQRFEAERKAMLVNRRLDAKVSELAAEKEHALALSRARTSFLAAMSHEFRTPMNAVIGLSDLLLDAPLRDEERQHARAIHDSARALLSLLNDILDFAKIDAEKLTLAPSPFDVRLLAASVLKMMRRDAESKSLSLEAQVATDVPRRLFHADEGRLRQVLVNLLSNALKFTERGRVLLDISAEPERADGAQLRFAVSDTGIGIEKEAISRLFQPFEQADQGIERRFGGTGLGLTISKRIVEAMGGTLSVESTPGQGSVFSFSVFLPFSKGARLPSGTWQKPPGAAPLAVLVVDDHPINRQVALASLKRLGIRADVASDGPEAIRAAERKRYDVIFMDLQMPKMDGIETTKRILAQRKGADPPRIVAMTASVREADRAQCFEAGMSAFVGKPVDLRELSEALSPADAGRPSLPTSSNPPPSAPLPAGPLDLQRLASLRALEAATGPGLLASLCSEFVEETTARLKRIEVSHAEGQWASVELEAHSLKSAAATIGAVAFSEVAARIEEAAHQGNAEEVTRALPALAAQWVIVEPAIRNIESEAQPRTGT